jgi:hypothetical protein
VVRSVLIDRSFELGAGRPRPGALPVRCALVERPARLAASH